MFQMVLFARSTINRLRIIIKKWKNYKSTYYRQPWKKEHMNNQQFSDYDFDERYPKFFQFLKSLLKIAT